MVETLVSAIIPTYNRESFILDAVQSVLKQTYENIETVVIDDGSTDDTRSVLEKFGGKIKYVFQPRKERSNARNNGFLNATGEYIAFLDSDDLWDAKKIEKQVRVLDQNPNIGVVYTDIEFIDNDGQPLKQALCWDKPRREALYEDLMTNNVVTGSTSTVMIRRECFEKVGLFDETMVTCEDLDLYRRIAQFYQFRKIDIPLAKIRIHEKNTQNDFVTMAKGWETTIQKIWQETPREFEYYKNEATIRILSTLVNLYWRSHEAHRFFSFLVKSAMYGSKWPLKISFWAEMFRLMRERHSNKI